MGWLAGWSHRKTVTITGQAGAGTDYQVNLSIGDASGGDFHLENHCTSFPNDITVTDNDQTSLLNHWVEDLTVDPISMWVEVADSLDSNADVCVYYTKSGESSASNGANTFEEYFDKNSTSGWTTGNMAVSTSGDFLRFYNPTASNAGSAVRYDLVLPSIYAMEARFKQISLGANDEMLIITLDGSTSHRFSQSATPQQLHQTKWYYYDGAEKEGGGWTEGTEFIMQHVVDEGDSSTGIDYRRYNTSRVLQDQVENENFAFGSPSDTDGIFIGDGSTLAAIDAYFRWIIFRKHLSPTEPAFSSAGSEESAPGHPTIARWHGIPGMNYTGRAGVSW